MRRKVQANFSACGRASPPPVAGLPPERSHVWAGLTAPPGLCGSAPETRLWTTLPSLSWQDAFRRPVFDLPPTQSPVRLSLAMTAKTLVTDRSCPRSTSEEASVLGYYNPADAGTQAEPRPRAFDATATGAGLKPSVNSLEPVEFAGAVQREHRRTMRGRRRGYQGTKAAVCGTGLRLRGCVGV